MSKQRLLDVQKLSMSFGGLKAVDDLSFHVEEGEIFGLIGPNGAGKTTVFNCITQFYQADAGAVYWEDAKEGRIDLNKVPVHQIIQKGIARTFQNLELIGELSVLENLLIGDHIRFKTSLLGELFQSKSCQEEEAKRSAEAMEILAFLGLEALALHPAGMLSYGNMKKVELGRSLISRPRLIILDEPAAGLNHEETAQLERMIREIQKRYGCSILLVEHDMNLVMQVCERLCAISFGKRLAMGSPEEIQANQAVQEAYLGGDDDEDSA